MALGINTTTRNLIVAQYKSIIDTASGVTPTFNAKLYLYSGTRPALGGTAPLPLTVAPLTFTSTTFFGTATGNVIAINAPGTATGSGDAGAVPGTACTWARLTNTGGTFVMDMNVSPTGATVGPDNGTVDLTMNDVFIVTGATITASANMTFTVLP